MKMEDKLSQTMKRATSDEPLPADVWEGFQRRARRSQQTRIAMTVGGLAVLIALAAVIVPKLGGDRSIISPTKPVDAEWVNFENPGADLKLRHPSDWKIDYGLAFEAFPRADYSVRTQNGSLQMFGSFLQVPFATATTKNPPLGNKTIGVINSLDYARYDQVERGFHVIKFLIDWKNGTTLSVQIGGPNSDLFDKRLPTALAIVESIDICHCADPTDDWNVYKKTEGGWSIKYPNGWKYGIFEGYSEIHPEDLPMTAKGEPTFVVSLFVKPERYDKDALVACDGTNESSCTAFKRGDDMFDGRPFIEKDESNRISFRVDWGTDTSPLTLEVTMQATSKDLWDQYLRMGNDVLGTIHHL
ncbi:MAG: hypothetical protein ABR548_00965 [Actinomycetota bacterium]|nr:hypothetical protein [Actinomycetota bacterium]